MPLSRAAGIAVPPELALAGQMAARDDVLDAPVASWRLLALPELAISHPSTPQSFGDGHADAIWA